MKIIIMNRICFRLYAVNSHENLINPPFSEKSQSNVRINGKYVQNLRVSSLFSDGKSKNFHQFMWNEKNVWRNTMAIWTILKCGAFLQHPCCFRDISLCQVGNNVDSIHTAIPIVCSEQIQRFRNDFAQTSVKFICVLLIELKLKIFLFEIMIFLLLKISIMIELCSKCNEHSIGEIYANYPLIFDCHSIKRLDVGILLNIQTNLKKFKYRWYHRFHYLPSKFHFLISWCPLMWYASNHVEENANCNQLKHKFWRIRFYLKSGRKFVEGSIFLV